MAGGALMAAASCRNRNRRHVGYDYVHSVIDAYSRVAYSRGLGPIEDRRDSAPSFFERAVDWFADRGVTIDAVLTDNGVRLPQPRAGATCAPSSASNTRRIRPYTPRTNGKVERFNRTLFDEWAYVRTYRSDLQRARRA